MRSTLFISESYYGTSRRVSDILALVLGYGKSMDIKEVPQDISKYNSLVFVFSFHGFDTAKKIKEYLDCSRETFMNKKIAIIGVGLLKKDLNNYISDIEKSMGRKADIVEFVEGELKLNKLTKVDKNIIQKFFNKMHMPIKDMGKFEESKVFDICDKCSEVFNKPDKEMPTNDLMDAINKFVSSHNTCTLATGYGGFVRNTPIEFTYYKNNFYFISEGGLKFKGILQNPNVCIGIFNEYKSMKELKGIQISGESEIIPYLSDEYIEVFSFRKFNIEFIRNLPVNLNLIKVVPKAFEFLNTDFNKIGFDAKQFYFVD